MQCKQRAKKRSGTRKEQERSSDLRDGEDAQTAMAAAADAGTAAGDPESTRGIGSGQTWNEGKKDGCNESESNADPENRRIEMEVDGAC